MLVTNMENKFCPIFHEIQIGQTLWKPGYSNYVKEENWLEFYSLKINNILIYIFWRYIKSIPSLGKYATIFQLLEILNFWRALLELWLYHIQWIWEKLQRCFVLFSLGIYSVCILKSASCPACYDWKNRIFTELQASESNFISNMLMEGCNKNMLSSRWNPYKYV